MTKTNRLANESGQATYRLVKLFQSATDDELAYGLTWYADAHAWADQVAERYGLTVRQVAGITAALSPQCPWDMNQRKAEQLIADGDTFGFGHGRRQAQRIAAGEDPADVLSGPKVRAFFDNLADPLNSETVVIDRHAFDAAAGMVTDAKTRHLLDRKGEYERVAGMFRSAASSLGVRPHVVQAVVWAVWRNRFGRFAYQHSLGA